MIESLCYSEDIVELDVIENFDNEKENSVFTKKKLSIEDFISFCTGSRYITDNLMRAGTIDFRYFEQGSSPGVRGVVNTCNTTITFPVNARYNLEPEQFFKNIIDDIYFSLCFGKCSLVCKSMKVSYESSCVVNSLVTYTHDIFVSTCLKYSYLLLFDTLFFIFCVSRNFVFSGLVCFVRRNHVLYIPLNKLKKVMLISELRRNTKFLLSLDTK